MWLVLVKGTNVTEAAKTKKGQKIHVHQGFLSPAVRSLFSMRKVKLLTDYASGGQVVMWGEVSSVLAIPDS